MKRQIEVFTAGCPVCEPVVELVKSTACSNCDVVIYNLSDICESKICLKKVEDYKITFLPAIVINGKLLSSASKEALIAEGVGLN